MRTALTIAGSDSSGGAGIQADLKTFQAHGVFGMTAITAVTVQNTQKVYDIQEIDPEIVKGQIRCLFEDIDIHAVKIGMVSDVALIAAIAEALGPVERPPVVLDPVMVSKSGYALLKEEAQQALVESLFPLAEVVTPNIFEAERLVGHPIATIAEMRTAAREILALGARKVVVKEGPVISVTDNRKVFFQEQAVDIADLKLMLAPYEEDKDTVPVYLRCDEEVPYGFVLKVMAAVEYEGFLNLSLVTDQPAPDEAP